MALNFAQGKPLVGHNCLLDFLHTYTHFIGPLPEVCEGAGGYTVTMVTTCVLAEPATVQGRALQAVYSVSVQ